MPVFNAYVDGFNLYMGALKGRPELKWLDLVAFCKAARPDMQLGKIYFFTAAISEKYPGDDAPRRQEKYLRVLAHQGVIVVRGKFQLNDKLLRTVTMQRQSVFVPELPKLAGISQVALNVVARKALPTVPKAFVREWKEKGSDVNLGSYLLRDALLKHISAALVVTGDSDLVMPVKFAVDAGVNVRVIVPNRKQNASALRNVATRLRMLHPGDLIVAQLPKTFIGKNGRQIVRPKEWA